MRTKLVAAAAAVGVAGGAVAAVAVPSSADRATPRRPQIAHKRPAVNPGPPPVRLVPGTMRIELRRDDPDGGAAWAIRSYTAAVIGHSTRFHCSQLVRSVEGRLGWIDGSNVFRPAGLESFGQAPTLCDRSAPGAHESPRFDARTLVHGIEGGSPRLGRTVVWGVAGAGAERVDLKLAGGRDEQPELAGRGAFLVIEARTPHRDEVSATYTYADGEKLHAPEPPARIAPRWALGEHGGTPDPGPVRLLARAPDPAGGLPWAVGGLRSDKGGICLSHPQRALGDRVGSVDFDLGTFVEFFSPSTECRLPNDPRLQTHPLATVYGIGDGTEIENDGAAAHRARVERRTQPGTTTVWGTARADVRSITIATPRDVRTVVPASDAHAFIAVYDGGFTTGKIVLTAHFADGTSKVVESFDVGGI